MRGEGRVQLYPLHIRARAYCPARRAWEPERVPDSTKDMHICTGRSRLHLISIYVAERRSKRRSAPRSTECVGVTAESEMRPSTLSRECRLACRDLAESMRCGTRLNTSVHRRAPRAANSFFKLFPTFGFACNKSVRSVRVSAVIYISYNVRIFFSSKNECRLAWR